MAAMQMQASAMKACFLIAECSFASAKVHFIFGYARKMGNNLKNK